LQRRQPRGEGNDIRRVVYIQTRGPPGSTRTPHGTAHRLQEVLKKRLRRGGMALHLRPDDLALLAQDEREVGAVRRRFAWGDPPPRAAVGAHPICVALWQTLD